MRMLPPIPLPRPLRTRHSAAIRPPLLEFIVIYLTTFNDPLLTGDDGPGGGSSGDSASVAALFFHGDSGLLTSVNPVDAASMATLDSVVLPLFSASFLLGSCSANDSNTIPCPFSRAKIEMTRLTGTVISLTRPANRAWKRIKSFPRVSPPVASALTLSTTSLSLTYSCGTETVASTWTKICGVQPLSDIHSCQALIRYGLGEDNECMESAMCLLDVNIATVQRRMTFSEGVRASM